MKKAVKRIALIVTVIIISGTLFGYFYLKRMMKAPPNTLFVSGEHTEIPVVWEKGDLSDREAMFIPVHIPHIPDTFYMQLDLGAIYSIIYKPAVSSIFKRYNLIRQYRKQLSKEFQNQNEQSFSSL